MQLNQLIVWFRKADDQKLYSDTITVAIQAQGSCSWINFEKKINIFQTRPRAPPSTTCRTRECPTSTGSSWDPRIRLTPMDSISPPSSSSRLVGIVVFFYVGLRIIIEVPNVILCNVLETYSNTFQMVGENPIFFQKEESERYLFRRRDVGRNSRHFRACAAQEKDSIVRADYRLIDDDYRTPAYCRSALTISPNLITVPP